MDRTKQGTLGTAQVTFTVDETLTDPAGQAVTVVVTRADGTVVQASSPATRVSVGLYSFVYTPAHTALLDVLTFAWTGNIGGQAVTQKTYMEVCGDFLCSLSDLRTRLTSVTDYPAQALRDARTAAEQDIEDACGLSFVPRYKRETITIGYADYGVLPLSRPYVRSVRSVVVDGTPLDANQLAAIFLDINRGVLHRIQGFMNYSSLFGSNVVVGYEHGLDRAPEPVRRACVDLSEQVGMLSAGLDGVDPRAKSIVTQDGIVNLFDPVSGGAGVAGLGLPTVDAVVERYGMPGIA